VGGGVLWGEWVLMHGKNEEEYAMIEVLPEGYIDLNSFQIPSYTKKIGINRVFHKFLCRREYPYKEMLLSLSVKHVCVVVVGELLICSGIDETGSDIQR
jgi:hypothetical protein